MRGGTRSTPNPSLGQRLARAFQSVTALIVTTLLVTGACFAAVLVHYEPTINSLLAGRSGVDQTFDGMLDEETGLRGYIATDNQALLAPYYLGEQEIVAGDSAVGSVASRSDLAVPILDMRVDQDKWLSDWATPALASPHTSSPTSAVAAFFLSGKSLLDAFRNSEASVDRLVDADIAAEQNAEHDLVLIALGIVAIAIALTTLVARRQHRALSAAVVAPITDLLLTMRRVGAGDLAARPTLVGPPELRAVAAELGRMTDTIATEQARAAAMEADVRAQSARLELIVDVSREISGSLSLRYVAEAVSKAAVSISGFDAARMWLIDDDRHELNTVPATGTHHAANGDHPAVPLGEGLVGRAGQFGRTLSTMSAESLAIEHRAGTTVSALAIPMIVGARIVGALELVSDRAIDIDERSLRVMHSLAGQAASAVEAARFHEHADELSHTDVLTQLPNRRRLGVDLKAEMARSERYHRPLAFVMIDVDQFKTVNDVYGHPAGDEVLSEFGSTFNSALRETDTAYRLGGDEFCVLLRETDGDSAEVVAERIRTDIAARFAGGGGSPTVTASLGVAAFPSNAIDVTALIAAADQALYAAKEAGRNCVVRATNTPSAMVAIGADRDIALRSTGVEKRRVA